MEFDLIAESDLSVRGTKLKSSDAHFGVVVLKPGEEAEVYHGTTRPSAVIPKVLSVDLKIDGAFAKDHDLWSGTLSAIAEDTRELFSVKSPSGGKK